MYLTIYSKLLICEYSYIPKIGEIHMRGVKGKAPFYEPVNVSHC